jgi:hypothetical protein
VHVCLGAYKPECQSLCSSVCNMLIQYLFQFQEATNWIQQFIIRRQKKSKRFAAIALYSCIILKHTASKVSIEHQLKVGINGS